MLIQLINVVMSIGKVIIYIIGSAIVLSCVIEILRTPTKRNYIKK